VKIAVGVLYMSDVHMLIATAATAATAASGEAVSRARGFCSLVSISGQPKSHIPPPVPLVPMVPSPPPKTLNG
jgi:hypothetical protein